VATKRSPLKQAERLEGASPDAPNFSAVLADNLARQEFRPPIFSGYATFENLPKFLPAEGGEGDAP
jgi:hypothetical protein